MAKYARHHQPWDDADDATLRRLWPDYHAAAATLGRGAWAVRWRARQIGLAGLGAPKRLPRRPWGADEDRVLIDDAGVTPAEGLARRLGRTTKAVYQRRITLGLNGHYHRYGGDFAEVLRREHAAGMADQDIADKHGRDRHAVGRLRRRLGLPVIPRAHPLQAAKWRTGMRKQLDRKGLGSAGDIRRDAFASYAASAGWPSDLRPRHVQILDALWRLGPRTRRQLCDDIGMRWRGSRSTLVSNDPEGSYLAHLAKRGLVSRLVKAVEPPPGVDGRGRRTDLYVITPAAVSLRQSNLNAKESDRERQAPQAA